MSVIRHGRQIPCEIYADGKGSGRYRVIFTPDGAGQYKIHISFNNNEIKGKRNAHKKSNGSKTRFFLKPRTSFWDVLFPLRSQSNRSAQHWIVKVQNTQFLFLNVRNCNSLIDSQLNSQRKFASKVVKIDADRKAASIGGL